MLRRSTGLQMRPVKRMHSTTRPTPSNNAATESSFLFRQECYGTYVDRILGGQMQLAQHPPIPLSPTVEEGFLKHVCGTVPGELLDVALAIKSKATTFVIISQ